MTEAAVDWLSEPEQDEGPYLALVEPDHGPIWVATLPNWRKRLVVTGAVVVVAVSALKTRANH
jgi:hypothetical protein